jgi:hypothetical protein
MGSFESDLHHHSLLSEMGDAELEKYIEVLRTDQTMLADLHDRDRRMLAMGGDEDRPLGKLRRGWWLRRRSGRLQTRLATAESELARRRSRRRNDWDEPTDTDLERLHGKPRAS